MKYKNNPLNIRFKPSNNWKGQIKPKNGFCQFRSLYCGFRAASIIFQRYREYGIDTPFSIVHRWAPPSENDVDSYMKFVDFYYEKAFKTGLDPTASIIYIRDYELLMSSMAAFEQGMFDTSWSPIISDVLKERFGDTLPLCRPIDFAVFDCPDVF